MDLQLFKFFEQPDFQKCFLTGADVLPDEKVSVFPEWIIRRYNLANQWMGMLNWNRVKYGELFIPCSVTTAEKISMLDETIRQAFESGYEKVKDLDEDLVFLWMARILLGILYHDIRYSIEIGRQRRKPYVLSPLLTRKFSDLHYMLQSLVTPVRWTKKPYSLVIRKVNYSQDVFNFRDETKNLNFSLGINDFGIVACLQDMGHNLAYHERLLKKMNGSVLHAIQFEELCARFVYSNFLLHENKGWKTDVSDEEMIMSPVDENELPEFSPWDDKMYAAVLPDYWKVWGIEPKDIYTFPDSPLSFLINETTNEFIQPDEIPLPS